MGIEFEVYGPKNQAYDQLNELSRQKPRRRAADYTALAENYNKAEIGAIILVGDHTTRVGNVTRILGDRGLAEDEDFIVRRPRTDANGETIPVEDRKILVKKLSDKKMKVL